MSKPGEFEIIERYFGPLAGEGSFGFQDDAALLSPTPGHSLVITQDAIAEGVHFLPTDPPKLIAQKAIRVNLSDLAAKGALPRAFSLALGLSEKWDETWISEFASGIEEDCKTFDLDFSGGDTFSTNGGFVISVTAIGEVPENKYTSRLTANVGDLLYVTGQIGDAALGLLAHTGKLHNGDNRDIEFLKERYWLPQPRLECIHLVRDYATASMDVSDGLVGDCAKLAKASGVAFQIEAAKVPLSSAVARFVDHESDYLKTALTGGDDYEILLTVAAETQKSFEAAAAKLPLEITCVGRAVDGEGVEVFDAAGDVLKFTQMSYDHVGTIEERAQ